LGIARGSTFELQTQLEIARSLKMGDPRLLDEADGLSREVGKMLFGMLESLKAAKRPSLAAGK
jgi:four helix bundle protein